MSGPSPGQPDERDSALVPRPGGDLTPDPAASSDATGSHDLPRLSTFSLEGRTVPALYLIGWVGSVMGLAVLLVAFMSSGSGAAPWLFLVGIVILGVGLVAAAGSQAVEGGRRPDLPYGGPSPVLTFVAVIALTLVMIVIVLAPLSALGVDAASPAATMLSLLLTTAAYVLVVRLLVVGPGALSWGEMGVRRPDADALRELLVGALLAVPAVVVTILLGAILATFLEPSPSPLPSAADGAGLLFNLISAAVIAPIGEELFFRGFATTAWFRSLGAAAPAIVRGAVFFAFAHVLTQFDSSFAVGAQRALFSFLALMPVAIALGWVFLTRRSLYAAIGLHGTFNAIQVVLAFAVASSIGS
ncbi:MAG TPA: type II CAAX endopeptidase family protein [Candidatus Limnocylindrales bacterium]|nr:type II CAAX endopeptidase family protein [Candidatus Limnocylindrales bacterium]